MGLFGFFKVGFVGGCGGVRLLFLWAGASGFQDASLDNGLGNGLGCSQVQEGQSDHRPLWLASRCLLNEVGERSNGALDYQASQDN